MPEVIIVIIVITVVVGVGVMNILMEVNGGYLDDGIPAYSAMSHVNEANIFLPPGPSCKRWINISLPSES